jgi:hypothetical protein
MCRIFYAFQAFSQCPKTKQGSGNGYIFTDMYHIAPAMWINIVIFSALQMIYALYCNRMLHLICHMIGFASLLLQDKPSNWIAVLVLLIRWSTNQDVTNNLDYFVFDAYFITFKTVLIRWNLVILNLHFKRCRVHLLSSLFLLSFFWFCLTNKGSHTICHKCPLLVSNHPSKNSLSGGHTMLFLAFS